MTKSLQQTKNQKEEGWKQTASQLKTPIIPYHCRRLVRHHNPDILKDGSNFIVIVGETGAGKSVLLTAIVPMFKIRNLIICSCLENNDVHLTIHFWALQHGIESCIRHTLEEATEAVAIAEQEYFESGQDPDQHTLLIIDDFSNYKSGRDESLNNFAIRIFCTKRNSGFSGVLITQCWSNVPTIARSCVITGIIVFPFNNYWGIEGLKKDLMSKMGQMKQWLKINDQQKDKKLKTKRQQKTTKDIDHHHPNLLQTSPQMIEKETDISTKNIRNYSRDVLKAMFNKWWDDIWEKAIGGKDEETVKYTFVFFQKPNNVWINWEKQQ